jgi:ABC-type Zn2+ transport system substrate-binding protein/surface adhesin
MVCLRNISVDTLHKGDTEDDDDHHDHDYDHDHNHDQDDVKIRSDFIHFVKVLHVI